MNLKRMLLYFLPGMILVAISAWLFCFPNIPFPGSEKKIARQKQKIQSLMSSIDKMLLENRRLRQDVFVMIELRKGAIPMKKDEVFILRERFDTAASKSGITIKTVGDIQKREIESDEFVIYEINFSAECNLKEFLALLMDFEKQLPRIYWRNLVLRPNFNSKTDLLNLSGTIALIAMGQKNEY